MTEIYEMPVMHLHYVAKHLTGMYGVWLDSDKLPRGVTLQPDDKYLPPGEYICIRDFYYTGQYPTFEIQIEGHDRVLFHKGNHEKDSKLCVLVGESYAFVEGSPGIAQSGVGFTEFWDTYKRFRKFKLIVTAKEGIL